MKTTPTRRSRSRAPYNVDQEALIPLPGIAIPGQAGTAGDDHAKTPGHSPTAIGDRSGTRGRSSFGQTSPDLSLSPPLYRGDRVGDSPSPGQNRGHKQPPKTKITGDCEPRCLTCHREDGDGHCQPGCATTCAHTSAPYKADVCITTTRADAHIVISEVTGYMHLHIRRCPHCGGHHHHAALDHPYRTAPCTRRPYLLKIHEPETTP